MPFNKSFSEYQMKNILRKIKSMITDNLISNLSMTAKLWTLVTYLMKETRNNFSGSHFFVVWTVWFPVHVIFSIEFAMNLSCLIYIFGMHCPSYHLDICVMFHTASSIPEGSQSSLIHLLLDHQRHVFIFFLIININFER